MTVLNPTANLTLLSPRERPGQGRRSVRPSAPIPFRRRKTAPDGAAGLAGRLALLDRLTMVATLAPTAPLSLVVVKVDGLSELNREFGWEAGSESLRLIGGEVSSVVRATDMAGRLTGTTFGIVLQGSGATAAGAVAARLSYRVNRMLPASQPVSVRVSAASGTGANADVLAIAALESFENDG